MRVAFLTIVALAACERGAADRGAVLTVAPTVDAAPPHVVPVATYAPPPEECVGSSAGDPIAARLLPLGAAGYCVDAASTKSYGDDAKYKLDDACSTLLDGECETYLKHGARRIVSLRYVSKANPLNAVYVVLSRYRDAAGVTAVLALRTQDPQHTPILPIRGVGSVILGRSAAYATGGAYLAELSFVSDDSAATADDVDRAVSAVCVPLAVRIEERLRAAE